MSSEGSGESKEIHEEPGYRDDFLRFVRDHTLTIFLVATAVPWIWGFYRIPVNSRWGAVLGNIVSEWTQIIGLVFLTKGLGEKGSKEANKGVSTW